MKSVKSSAILFAIGLVIGVAGTARFFYQPPPPPSTEAPVDPKQECMKVLGLYDVPLLDPPKLKKAPEMYETNDHGEVYLRWDNVDRAKEYLVVVLDATDKEIRNFKCSHSYIYLKHLPKAAGPKDIYYIRLASINANGITGKFSDKKPLWIKPPLDLTAPKIEEIRIEK